MMFAKDESNYVFNLKLLRWTALHQVLGPAATIVFGHNVYHVVAVCANLVLLATVTSLVYNVYHIMNTLIGLTFYLGCIENYLFASWKMYLIIYRCEDIWMCMKATGLNMMAYRHYDRKIIEKWRSRSFWITGSYIAMISATVISWSLTPFVFNSVVSVRNRRDGSCSEYRMNIYNFFTIVSDEWYNGHFAEFYFAELTVICSYSFIMVLFDLISFTLTFTLLCQMETISDAIQSFGYDVTRTASSTDDLNIKNRMSFKRVRKEYDDLKTILTDHQHVLKLLEDYYDIVRSTFLIQIVTTSSTLVILVYEYIGLLSVVTDNLEDFIMTVKLIVVFPFFIFQLLMTCYLFGSVNEKKDSIIFALYSCNWTELDLESKKLILLAMKMNNSNQLKLKLTNTKTVDLEMFTNTVRTCFTIVSMLSNYNPNEMK